MKSKEPHNSTEPGKITAEYYFEYGKSIATDGDHVMVSSFREINILKHRSHLK